MVCQLQLKVIVVARRSYTLLILASVGSICMATDIAHACGDYFGVAGSNPNPHYHPRPPLERQKKSEPKQKDSKPTSDRPKREPDTVEISDEAIQASLFEISRNETLSKAAEILQVGSLVGKSKEEIAEILDIKRREASELSGGDHEDRQDAKFLFGRIKDAEELLDQIEDH